jgi:hypothetical protein
MTSPFGNRNQEEPGGLQSSSSNPLSNDIGSFQGRPDSSYHDGNSSDNQETKSGNDNEFETSGSINFAMRLHNDPELNRDGAVIAMETSSMKIRSSIPCKSGSNFFASCEGNTGFMKQRGFANSTLSLGYNVRNSTALLYDWNTADGLSKVSSNRVLLCTTGSTLDKDISSNKHICHLSGFIWSKVHT